MVSVHSSTYGCSWRVAITSRDSYAPLVLINLPHASITRRTQARNYELIVNFTNTNLFPGEYV